MKELLSVKEFSKLTGMPIGSIYKIVKEGRVKHVRIGKRIFFCLDDLKVDAEKEGENEDGK